MSLSNTSYSKSSVADAARWAAVVARDKAADGSFVYSVATTGIYCRPSCPARRANRQNVQFHASPRDAEAKGFRPCKRCRPAEASHEEERQLLVAAACRKIEEEEYAPSLDELARVSGLSRFHFHRIFREIAGVTPKEYARAHRRRRVQRELRRDKSVTRAIYKAGYNSSSRFYADASGALGMSPRAFQESGKDMKLHFAVGECSLGAILVAASDRGIAAILLGDDPDALIGELEKRFSKAKLLPGDAKFKKTVAEAVALVENPEAGHGLPLDVRGTAFQHRVWRALAAIPPGKTATYAEIARSIGSPKSVRAVARACASNAHAVAIPCHRVIKTGGGTSGYRWGVERKRALLTREAAKLRPSEKD